MSKMAGVAGSMLALAGRGHIVPTAHEGSMFQMPLIRINEG